MVKFLHNSMGHILYIVICFFPTPQDIVELEEILKRAKGVLSSVKKNRFWQEAT